jgi:ferric-dicitrate binding protein FerR (iron transport regulator)
MDKILLENFFENNCTEAQRQEVIRWILDPQNDREMKLWMEHHWHFFSDDELIQDVDLENIWYSLQYSLLKEVSPLQLSDGNSDLIIKKPIHTQRRVVLLAAALFAGLIAIGFFYFSNRTASANIDLHTLAQKGFILKQNNTDKEVAYTLADGSIVKLKPHASLYFPPQFLPDKREVYLSGEAFFQVTKNPQRPFYVYYKNLVTHVIGTSFTIRAEPNENTAEINVKTGRVEVYENVEKSYNRKNNGVVLTPNQKVTYYAESNKFEASVVDKPVPLVKDSTSSNYQAAPALSFNDAHLTDVIATLENTYGIEIIFENENFNNCLFTGDLKDENLYNVLDIVCKSVNADYAIKGTKILIKGNGCNP